MKNKFIFFYFSILLILVSCNFSYEPTNQSSPPTVDYNNKSIVLSIPKKTNTAKYINIYRLDITEKATEDEEENIQNIGILYPQFADTEGTAFIFYDSYIIKNHSYRYMIRYTDLGEYTYSRWSNDIVAKDGYDSTTQMTYNTSSAYLSYDSTFYSIKIKGTITPPTVEKFDDDFQPMIIARTAEKTQVFPLQSIEQDTTIQLRSILPSSFLDTPVTIVGIVPQKNCYVTPYSISNNRAAEFEIVGNPEKSSTQKEDSTENSNSSDNSTPENNSQINQTENDDERTNNPDIKQIHWLPATSIKLSGFSDNTITIPSSAQSDGFDYSRKSE